MKSLSAKTKRAIKACIYEGLLYVGIFALTFFLFLMVRPLVTKTQNGFYAHSIPMFTLVVCTIVISYMGITKRLECRHIVIMLLIFGYALRIGYTLASPAFAHQHDVFTAWFDGHEAYAWTIFETGALPTHNEYQMYHPPLNAMTQAGFMHLMKGLSAVFPDLIDGFAYGRPEYLDAERYYLYTSCQILSVTWSFITAVLLLKILKTFSFSDKVYTVLTAIVILYPRNIQFATMLNNDVIAYMLATAALFFALRWWKSKSLAYILPCGLAVGLGMMAKLSAATVCIPIAGIFIYEFICTLRKKEGSLSIMEMVLQYGLFLAICAPIGLWFQVYAYARFAQPLGHVFSNLNQNLYTGDKSFFERFVFTFDLSEYLGSLYCRSFDNYNLFNFSLRSSIFGEHSYSRGHIFGAFALLFAYMVAFLLAAGLVYCIVIWVKDRKKPLSAWKNNPPISFKELLFVFLLVQSQVLSEMYFYIKMPYGCTMDFRYIMPLILGMALAFGYVQKTLAAAEGGLAVKLGKTLYVTLAGFLISSTLFYCICV